MTTLDGTTPTIEKVGRYEVIRKIATGGMAELYLARFMGPGGFEKRCALKRILPQFANDQIFTRMFLNEARVTAMFDHPNLVQIFELGQDDRGQFFIAMELVNGLNLRQLLHLAKEHGRRIPPELATFMMMQALDGLAYAHTFRDPDTGQPLQLIHRDVSPQNILASYEGAVKLVDFGIVKGASVSTETQAGMLKGKVTYMSPEQAAGDPIDARSDLFSLGVCFYELVAGERPFKGANDIMTLKAILDQPAPPVSAFVPDVAESIEAAIMKALEKDPALRFSSAREFQVCLTEILRDCPTPIGRHVIAEFIQSFTESSTLAFDATRLRIPRRSAGFGQSLLVRPPEDSNSEAAVSPLAPPVNWNAPPSWPKAQSIPVAEAVTPTPQSDGTGTIARAALGPSMLPKVAAVAVLSGCLSAVAVWAFTRDDQVVVESAHVNVDQIKVLTPPEPPPSVPKVPVEPVAPVEPVVPPPPPAVPVVEPPPPKKEALREKKRRDRRLEHKRISVKLTSTPAGLTVKSGGRTLGVTPAELALPAGNHQVALVNGRLGISRTLVLKVPADGVLEEKVVVGRGTVKVLSRPWADVYVGDEHRGKTPLTLPLYEGNHRLRLVNPEAGERIQTVAVEAGKEALVTVKF